MALPEMLFSTAGISRCSRTGKPLSMTSLASASACAAPPISFFINPMPLAGLMSSPPESKVTPLPMMAMRGKSSRPHFSSMSRGSRSRDAARPTAAIIG